MASAVCEWKGGSEMALNVTQVHRNLAQRVTFLGLEFEDLFVVLGLAALTNIFGRFLDREMFGIPMNVFLQYVVPVLTVPFLILFKYGKPRRYLLDFVAYYSKPKVYCGLEPDAQQDVEYLRPDVEVRHAVDAA
jgi:hypothetical protein